MKVCCYAEPLEKGLLLHYPTKAVKSEMLHLWEGAKQKYNGYMTVTLDKPYKSRTAGPGSQNNLFWKLVEYISNENGEEPKIVERDLKVKAIAKGYPYHVSKITGQPEPESMTKINTVEMSYLIDTAYEVCSFLGIVLEPDLKKEEAPKIKDTYANEYDIF
jgi:hypothetical protein